jgi:Flp pilus assembly protein TadG
MNTSIRTSGTTMTSGTSVLRRLKDDARGNVAIIFTLVITGIFGALGLAIDLNRAVSINTKLGQILDIAAVAGAKMLDQDVASDQAVIDRVTSFVKSQGLLQGVPPTTFANLTITIDRANNQVSLNAIGAMTTTFAKVMGFQSVAIQKAATATYRMKDVELALVLDTTGSMAEVPAGDTKTKIESLKTTAALVVDTLFAQAVNDRGIRVAIAPFSAAVNAGSYASQVTGSGSQSYSSYFATSASAASYSNCVVERSGAANATDAPPSSGLFPTLTSVGGSQSACPQASIIPLTGRSQIDSLKSTIANFAPGGSTAGHIGTAWGWYMLSPSWNSVFGLPYAISAYGAQDVSKNVVIMTDGLFNTSYLTGASAGTSAAVTESYSQFDALCAGMKAQNINVYTIGFGLTDPTATSELSKCASVPANFFPVANGSDLQAAFATIVAKLNTLRVSR